MCREVKRPLLFRPPLLFFTSVKLLCGLFAEVTSVKAGSDLKRRTGVSGRKLLSAIKLDEIDLLALLQGYDRFLPMWFAAEISAAFALLFARVIGGIHRHDLLVEEPLDRLFDLDLVCARRNAEHVLVQLFAQQRRLLGQLDRLDQIVGLVHFDNLSARCSNAAGVTKILSNARSCSAFTSATVASCTGFTFRADL